MRTSGSRRLEVRPEFEQVGDRIIASARWVGEGDRRQDRYQVITVKGGKITDMQGFRSRREAERFAHR